MPTVPMPTAPLSEARPQGAELSSAPHREEAEVVLSPQDPLYVVQQAMNAILIDQPLVCIPRLTYFPYMART